MAPKATETVETATTSKGRQLQATVSQEVYDAYDAHHWDARKNVVDLVREALIEFGQRKGFLDADGKPVVKAADETA